MGLEGENPQTHKVKAGETFYSIGKRLGIDYKLLLKWNKFTEATAHGLKAGATITLVDPNAKKGNTQTKSTNANKAPAVVKQAIDPNNNHKEPEEKPWYNRMFTDPDFGFGNDDGPNQGGYMGGQQGWEEKGGKQLFFGTIGVVTAPFTIGGGLVVGGIEGTVYVVAGTVSLLNGIDDMGSRSYTQTVKDAKGNTLTQSQVESLTQSLISDPNWKKNVGTLKVGATIITVGVGGYGGYQVWKVGNLNSIDGGVTLIGVANDANSLGAFLVDTYSKGK